MKIQYTGRQKPHRERLYGTGVVFAGPGDTQDIEDEAVAQKMLSRHPDQYGPAAKASPPPTASAVSEKGTPPTEGFIVLDGEQVALEDLSKDVLIETAKKHYDVEIPVRTGKPEIVGQLTKLISEYGQPE